jgi:putative nucleotidyltransferase with HDIG domain
MKLETTFLRSKVARRIFFLFASCTLLPIILLGIFSFQQVAQQSLEQCRSALQQASKTQGMQVLERLDNLKTELRIVSLQAQRGEATISSSEFQEHFATIAIYRQGHLATSLRGSPSPLPPSGWNKLQPDKPWLITHPCEDHSETCVQMVIAVHPDEPADGMIVGEVRTEYLWDKENLPPGFDVSIFKDTPEGPVLLQGVMASRPPTGRAALQSRTDPFRYFEWKADGKTYESAYWEIFLAPGYQTGSWIVVASGPRESAASAIYSFRHSFPLIILLTLWFVLLASLVQIRRTMVPLERLHDATKQIAAQRFESRVQVSSGDEFEQLAGSFNTMAAQLGDQFQALKTIGEIANAILGSLDQDTILNAVLDRVPELHTSACSAIALIEDSRLSGCSSLSLAHVRSRTQRELIPTDFCPTDLRLLQANPHFFQTQGAENVPDFLRPLVAEDVSCFSIFPIFLDSKPFGALIYGHSRLVHPESADVHYARQVADQLAVAFSNTRLIAALEQLHWGTLKALARAIDAKSNWTGGHSERVTRLALRIGQAMGLSSEDLKTMERGGLLHDVGKIGTPREVLDKPGKLDDNEMEIMREHVNIGMRILEPIPGLSQAIPIVAQHHERFDGKGYPNGLKGEQISLLARIFAIADSFDAMTSDRPYRSGVPTDEAVSIIASQSGGQFDPQVVAAFLELFGNKNLEMDADVEEKLVEPAVRS